MAKIPLRVYTKEIDGLIDRGQYEQALAHCRYILKYIPKHIDTYRLMAKAYLESQRYGDASDVFQRVLSSVPDDFVSQLGMSIIREDEGNLDAAIWHMERAFEIQPANGAIQSELRRLYGRRDGIEPPKIRLTRGALARMYYKGELYPQAINELRAALAADPQRPDLQLLLAKSYERAGQKVEAVTACNAVLNKLPYCIEANRIQAEILEHTGRAEDARLYRQRAIAMDPYLGQTNPKAPNPEQVPDEAIVLERLDWMPDKSVASQPRWAASLGVDIGSQPANAEDVPEWLQELETRSQASSAASDEVKVSPFVSETDGAESAEEKIPDWMKEAGWEPSSGDTTMAEMGYTINEEEDDAESEGLAPAEIPGWLRGLAPDDAFSADQPTGLEDEVVDQKLIEALDSAALPWLEETPPGPGDTIAGWLGEDKRAPDMGMDDASKEGLPDWLVGAAAAGLGAAVGAAAGEDRQPEEEPTLDVEQPVQAELEDELLPESDSAAGFEAPDWLSELEAAEQPEPDTGESAPAEKGELPEWLVGAAAVSAAGQLLQSEPAEEEQGQADLFGEFAQEQESEEELPEWLRSTPMEAETPVSMDEIPDWLTDAQPGDNALEALGLTSQDYADMLSPETEQPTEYAFEAPVAETTEEELPGEMPEWMSEAQPPEEEPGLEPIEGGVSGLPEWLVGAAGAAAGATIGAAALAGSGEDETAEPGEIKPTEEDIEPEAEIGTFEITDEQPDLISSTESVEFEPDEEVTPEEEEAAFAWLEGLAAKQGVSEALLLSPEERLEEPPDWIQKEAALAAGAVILGGDEDSQPLSQEELEADEVMAQVSDEELLSAQAAAEEGLLEWAPEELLPSEMVEKPELADSSPLDGIPTDTSPEEFLPDWLRAAGPESEVAQAEAELSDEGEIPAWLSQIEIPEEEISKTPADMLEEELSEEEMLDWLPELSEELELDEVLAEEGEDEILADWLSRMPVEGVETGEAVQQAEVPDDTQPEQAEIPAWVAGAAAAAMTMDRETAPEEEPSALDETIPTSEPELAAGMPDWLEEPEPGGEETAVGVSTDRLEIEEPAITPADTQPSAAAETGAEEASEPPTLVEGELAAAADAEKPIDEEALADEDAAFAWLEGLAVKQGATEALLLSPEERLEEPPEWVIEETMLAEDQLLEPSEPQEVEQELDRETGKPPQPVEAEEELPDWLIGAGAAAGAAAAAMLAGQEEQPDVEPEPVKEPEAPELVLPELDAEIEELIPTEEMPELPEWLADLEPEAGQYPGDAGDKGEWLPEMADVASISEAVALEKEITPLDVNKAALIEIERLPGVGFRRAQALIEYRQQQGPLESIEQLSEVEGFDPELIDELSPYLQVARPALKEADIQEEISLDLLIQARAAIYKDDIDTALGNYQSLIQQKMSLPDVVKDLEEALYTHPVDVSIWTTLGDAQMRAGQLHKAMESYNKAEELLL